MVYGVSYDDVRVGFAACERLGLGPSLGIYEPGALRTVLAWQRAGRLPRGAGSEARTLIEYRAQVGIEPRQQGARKELPGGAVIADIDRRLDVEQVAAHQRERVAAEVVAEAHFGQHDRCALDRGVHGSKQGGR